MKNLNILISFVLVLFLSHTINAQCWIDESINIVFKSELPDNRCTYDIHTCALKLPASATLIEFEITSGDDYYYQSLACPGNTGDGEIVTFHDIEFDCEALIDITMTVTKPGPDCVDQLCDIPLPKSILPVVLENFEVSIAGDDVILKWNTLEESNNAGFDIERSSNGKEYYYLGTIKSNEKDAFFKEYTFVDEQPLNSWNYYQLRQFDFDGNFEYFGPEVINYKSATKGKLLAWPNPTNYTIKVEIEATEYPVKLYLTDIVGRALNEYSFNDGGVFDIPLVDFAPGGYLLRLEDATLVIIKTRD
jgi:hypothetical protein